MERVLLEKSDLQEVLMKLETVCSNHEQEKQQLQEELKKVIFYEILSMFIIKSYILNLDNRRKKQTSKSMH